MLRTDIVMDVGKSLNPGIDIGQIEGAFTQGYGLLTLEQQRYTPKGQLITRGPGMYKIPGFSDIPIEMNVTLLKGASNPKAVYSSKVTFIHKCFSVYECTWYCYIRPSLVRRSESRHCV